MFCVVTEETTRVIGERRLGLLREFGTRLAASQTMQDVWAAVEQSTATDARDLPFTLAYLVGDERHDGDAGGEQQRGRRRSDRAGSRSRSTTPMWPIRTVLAGASATPVFVDLDPTAAWPCGPWRKPPARAIVLPIAQQAQTRPAGVFIAGLNPYRPIDAEYESFITLVRGPARGRSGECAGVRGRAPACRGAGADRSREDDVLLEREPRIPHAAHVDAGAGGRSAEVGRSGRGASGAARARPSQCAAAAEACEHAARLLPDRGGPRPAVLRADRPRRTHREPRQRVPIGDRPGRSAPWLWTASRSASWSTSTATCGRRSF